jgi:hypothetical protein
VLLTLLRENTERPPPAMKGTYDTDVVMDDGTVIRTTVTSSGDAV